MNNESFDDLLNRLNNQEKQQVIEYAYMYDDLRYLREHGRYLQKQLKAYENMRKEAIEYTKSHFKEMVADEEAQILLDILNKVGSDK